MRYDRAEELRVRLELEVRELLERAELKRRTEARAASERAEYERKVAERESREGSRKGKHIKSPSKEPRPEGRINLTDADSGLMRKNKRSEYRQAYNAQAVVDAGGSRLVLADNGYAAHSGLKVDVGRARGAGTPKRRFRRKLSSESWALHGRLKSRSSPTGC